MRHRLWLAARAIALGWAALLLAAYVVERPLLNWLGHLLGAAWFPTARVALDCVTLAATGWVVGRLNRSGALLELLAFAATLCFWDFGRLLTLNVPWLVRLAVDATGNLRYLEGLAFAAGNSAILFGSLLAGWSWDRREPAQPTRLVS